MKRLIIIFIVFLSFSSSLKSQTGWIVLNTGINADLTDIKFINPNTGFITADTNCIFKSTNGGLNWFSIPLNITLPVELLTISFLNQSTGYAGGGHHISEFTYTRYLFKTTDGGNNWLKIFHDSSYSMIGAIANIIPFNANDIFISNIGYVEVFMQGGIYKSTNGGIDFSVKFSGYCNSLSFINQNTGYAVTKRTSDYQPSVTRILKTTDGCASWTVQHRDSANGISSYFSKIQAFDANTAYALNNSGSNTRFFKTSNGGENWSFTQAVKEEHDMFFINSFTGWSGGYSIADSLIISYTTNAGTNWVLQKRGINSSVQKLFFLNESTGWALLSSWGMPPSLSKRIMKTTTSGITFVNNVNCETPTEYSLSQNYPNPFNPSTTVIFSVPHLSNVRISIYDITGKEIEELENKQFQAGNYKIQWNASNISSGIYFFVFESEQITKVKKMILQK